MAIPNLNLASNTFINSTLSRMRANLARQNQWLDTANRYLGDASAIVEHDIKNNTLNANDLIEYIASSISIHCFNGWSYLSSAANALIDGDYGNAIHNAYYAELRTIIAFLAMQGIGVFSNEHVIVDAGGNLAPVIKNGGTHQFAKNAFDQWLNDPANEAFIIQNIEVEGKSIQQWIQSNTLFQSTALPNRFAYDWLNDWSMDLNIIKQETNFRNYVSYRPQAQLLIPPKFPDNIQDRLGFVSKLWRICEPGAPFATSILRKSLERLYQNLFGKQLHLVDVESEWKPMMVALGLNPEGEREKGLIDYLSGQTFQGYNEIFNEATKHNYQVPMGDHLVEPTGIISRATLLLLVVTSCIKNTLRSCGYSKADLNFWFENIGVRSGHWAQHSQPALFSDLWMDIEREVLSVETWINNAQIQHSPYGFQNNLKGEASRIHQINRAYLWEIIA